jgi:Flp pilus assembly protein TadG
MISHFKNRLSQFRKEEAGAVYTVEFAVMLPLLFLALPLVSN